MSENSCSAVSDKRLFKQAMLGYVLKGRFRLSQGHRPQAGPQTPEDFSGVRAAFLCEYTG